ncbi:MazG-like family protein [Rummeliibacillus sp. TYF-LIM-RU47]|uniref:MazG-like family protein n=1 Tax=Rummeliibacillus sp. TYF-LIM-RU47 TaxID=2608406 RepID=UPI00123B2363|nr:MazG-like family protein [Rummeliibacillus sp. TYF-LIM-RU47]
MNELTNEIRKWAIDRELESADPYKQMLKLGEEFGELCQGMAKSRMDEVIDAIGDMYVVLTILSMQLDVDIQFCVQKAYNEIANRKGRMVNGVFVKEADLNLCPHQEVWDDCPDCRH